MVADACLLLEESLINFEDVAIALEV